MPNQKMSVEAIKDGTVIDHIPAGQGLAILRQFKLLHYGSAVTVGFNLPSKSAGRTAEGGMGYTDAYGNTIDDRQPEEKPARQRPHPGAYGPGAGQSDRYERPLPNPQNQTPAWSFK